MHAKVVYLWDVNFVAAHWVIEFDPRVNTIPTTDKANLAPFIDGLTNIFFIIFQCLLPLGYIPVILEGNKHIFLSAKAAYWMTLI